MGTTSVRRNLFHHHLSRRPGSAAPPAESVSTTANGTAPGFSHMQNPAAAESTSSLSSGNVDNGEIVSRDKNGSYKLDIPILPPVVGEDGEEMDGMDDGRAPGSSAATGADSTAQTEINGREKESSLLHPHLRRLMETNPPPVEIEASLVELMYRNRNRQMSSEPAGS